MEKQKLGLYIFAAVVVIAATIILVALINNPNVIPQPQKRTITVDGSFTQSVAPDKIEVTFSILTKADTASKAQNDNTLISNKIIAALKDAGYTDADISTVYYNVYPEYNWSSGTNTIIGYTATHQIKVNSTNISAAGTIVDIAIKNGANEINYIDFGLKQETEQALRAEALAKASQNAREKADAIAKGLGTSVKGIISVNEGNIYFPPYRFDFASAAEKAGSYEAVQITPGNVEVSARVSVVFELN